MKISEFKSGNIIVRTKRSSPNHDGSYIGEPFELLCTANAMIYLKSLRDGELVELEQYDFNYGWELYVNPLQKMIEERLEQIFPSFQSALETPTSEKDEKDDIHDKCCQVLNMAAKLGQ